MAQKRNKRVEKILRERNIKRKVKNTPKDMYHRTGYFYFEDWDNSSFFHGVEYDYSRLHRHDRLENNGLSSRKLKSCSKKVANRRVRYSKNEFCYPVKSKFYKRKFDWFNVT